MAEWRGAMQAEMRTLHSAATALAYGGTAQLTPSRRGRLGARLRQQYDYLSAFALDYAQGRLSPAQAQARAQLYGVAVHAAFATARGEAAHDRGATHERNVLGPAEHSCPGCLAETARGLVPLGELVPVGQRQCVMRCLCSLVYETRPAAVGTRA